MSEATNYTVFGRQVAQKLGWTDVRPIDLERYGQACGDAMRVGSGKTPQMPDPRDKPEFILPEWRAHVFGTEGAAPVSGSRAETPGRQAAAPIADIHVNPRTVKEVRELVADGIISKAQGRVYLGLKPHWWSA